MNYTDPVKPYNPDSPDILTEEDYYSFDDVMTVEDFECNVKMGVFNDYDGVGYPVKNNLADKRNPILPSNWKDTVPFDATHIVWYNK